MIRRLADDATLLAESPDLLAQIEGGVREYAVDPEPSELLQWVLLTGANAVAITLHGVPDRSDDLLWFCKTTRRLALDYDPPALNTAANRTLEAYRVHFNRGEYGEAQAGLHELVQGLPAHNDQLADAYIALATLEARRGGTRRDEYLALAEACPNKGEAVPAQIELERAWSWVQLGLLDHAAPSLERARKLVDELEPEGDELAWTRARIATTVVEFSFLASRYESAVAQATALLADDLLTVERNAYFIPRVRTALAFALGLRDRSDQDVERAARIFREVIDDSESDAGMRSVAAGRLGYIELQRGNYRAVEAALGDARARLGDIDVDGEDLVLERGFLAAVRCRLLIAEERHAELAHARTSLTSAFRTLVARWHATPSPEGGRGLLQYFLPRVMLSTLCEVELALDPEEGELAALEHVFHAQTASTLLAALGGAEPSLETFRSRLLSNGVGVVTFVPGQMRSFVIAVDRHGCDVVPVGRAQEIRSVAQTFQHWVTQAPGGTLNDERSQRLSEAGAQLRETLFPVRIASRVERWSHLAFLGNEHLANLCIEALPWRDNRLLGHEKAVFSMFAMPVGLALSERPILETRGLGLLASPEHSAPPSPLALNDRTVKRLALATLNTAVHVRADASLDALVALSKGDHSAWTIITHGLYDMAHAIPSGVLLSASATHDGRVFSEDVRRLRSAPVIFLGACSTGRGPARAGDAGASTLAAAFFEAGARVVIDANNAVPTAETLSLAAEFQRELFAGIDPAEAMRRARTFLAGQGWEDPYYTCLLGVRGLGHVPLEADPVAETQSTSWSLMVGAAIAGALMAALLWLSVRQ